MEEINMYFAWKEEYSVYIDEIDEQHKKIFEIGRKVSNMIFAKDENYSKEDVLSILEELNSYTEFHFKFEEDMMKEYGYAHYETHKHEHEILIEGIQKIEWNSLEKLQKDTLMELINFIFVWISNHILNSDKKYSDLISDKYKM